MKPMTFINHMLPEGISLFPEQEKLLTEFYEGGYRELIAITGRRSGKNLLLSLMASYEYDRLLQLLTEKKYTNISKDTPIYILIVSTASEQSEMLFNETKSLITKSSFFKNKIHDINFRCIWLKDNNNEPSICLKCVTSGDDAVSLKCFCLLFNEIGSFYENSVAQFYTKMTPSLADFHENGHIAIMSNPSTEGSFLHRLSTKMSHDRLVIRKPTWEMNPNLTKEMLRNQFSFMSDEDFNCEFGATFKQPEENTTVSLRLSVSQLDALKRLSRLKAYESDTDVSYVDLIRKAIENYLQSGVD